MFKALGDETRIKILIILSRRRICAKGIAKHLNISESAVSQHLKILREADIIKGEKIGYYVHYKLEKSMLIKVNEFIKTICGEGNSSNDVIDKLELEIPSGCKAMCKLNRNKCCEK